MRMKTLIVATLDCCVLALVVVRSNYLPVSKVGDGVLDLSVCGDL